MRESIPDECERAFSAICMLMLMSIPTSTSGISIGSWRSWHEVQELLTAKDAERAQRSQRNASSGISPRALRRLASLAVKSFGSGRDLTGSLAADHWPLPP